MIFKDITETNFNGIDISSHFEFDHEKVFYFEDSKSGLKSLIAIHDSINGPALVDADLRIMNHSMRD